MAACDYLYGNKKEWQELHDFFIEKKRKKWVKMYMRSQPDSEQESRICYIASIQGWLVKNCPLSWVKERLDNNFDIQALICGTPHHLMQ